MTPPGPDAQDEIDEHADEHAGERSEGSTLAAFLHFLRESALAKTSGLPQAMGHAVDPLVGYSLFGVLHHLEDVETFWIRHVFLGEESRALAEDNFVVPSDWDHDVLAARYREAGSLTDSLAATTALNSLSATPRHGSPVPLRWILVHLVEETARHCGHIDILRQQIDGKTGPR
jgi:uncharacterized damage-inducible protein DinB